jgi:hypothetical protein
MTFIIISVVVAVTALAVVIYADKTWEKEYKASIENTPNPCPCEVCAEKRENE